MGRQISYVSYSGLDKDRRIDCLAQIRRIQNPPGSTCLDTEGLCRINRSTKEDARAGKEQRIPGQFVNIGRIEF